MEHHLLNENAAEGTAVMRGLVRVVFGAVGMPSFVPRPLTGTSIG